MNGSYVYPSDLIKLYPTKHFVDRLNERGIGIDCIPSLVRVTKDNIHSAEVNNRNELISVVVRLKYSSTKYIFLVINPFDGALKTLWFREKGGKNGSGRGPVVNSDSG